MDPDQIIYDLCERYGVSPDFGHRLRPLITRAQKSSPEARQRIMDMVERSFAQEATRQEALPLDELPDGDRRILVTVAGILHSWRPPTWLKFWNELQPPYEGSEGTFEDG